MEAEDPFRQNAPTEQQSHHHKTAKRLSSIKKRPDWMTFNLARDAKETLLRPRHSGGKEGLMKKRRKMTMKEVEEKLLAAETDIPDRPAVTVKKGSSERQHRGRKRRRSPSSSPIPPKIVSDAESDVWRAPTEVGFDLDTEEAEPEEPDLEPDELEELEDPGSEPQPLGPPPLQGLEDYYDMSVDYRGNLDEPTEPVNSTSFPKLPGFKSDADRQRDKVAEWEELVEKRKKIVPYNVDLVKHTEDRLLAHKTELEKLIVEEPLLCVGFSFHTLFDDI